MGILIKDTQTTDEGVQLSNCYAGVFNGHIHIRKGQNDMYHVECEFGVWSSESARRDGFTIVVRKMHVYIQPCETRVT